MEESMKKYAFVDRDGTMIVEPQDTFQIDSLDVLELLPGVIDCLKELQEDGYSLVMVSNQNGIGTPSFPQENFDIPQKAFEDILKNEGIEFDLVLVCPHFPEDNCECRKPKLGLVKDFDDIDKENSIMIGDRDTDLEFAKNLGIRGIKIELNKGMEHVAEKLQKELV